MSKLFYKGIITAILAVLLTVGGLKAVDFTNYRMSFDTARWHIIYNAFVTAVQTEIAALANLIANLITTVDSLTLIQAAPTHSDDHTFSLPGDYTALLTANKRLVADCGADGLMPNTVAFCTYAAPNSTVVVNIPNLTPNLAAVSYYATRNGINTYGSGDVVAGEYGAPSWDHLQAAVAVANASGRRLLLTPGTWPLTDNLTTTAPGYLVPGAILSNAGATTKNLTINGPFEAGLHQVFDFSGTGTVIFGRPSGVKELVPQWWGAKGDAVLGVSGTDDIIPLQAMVDCSVASGGLNMFVPAGIYKITDTLKLHKGTCFMGFTFRGAGGLYTSAFGTAFDATAFGDRPAINVQGARSINLKDFSVFGKNVAPKTAEYILDPVLANWITPGCNDTQFAPYAGVSIGAYCGTAPVGGYTNDAYGRYDCSFVRLENITISGFVAGLAQTPCNYGANNDAATIRDCIIVDNTYGYSIGNNQSRGNALFNTNVSGNYVSVTTGRHGLQAGIMPNIYGGIFQLVYKLFETGNGYTHVVLGIHAEAFGWLGEFGLSGADGAEPSNITGCHFSLYNPVESKEPYFFIANKSMKFDSCEFQDGETLQVFNYLNQSGVTKFDSCKFSGFPNSVGFMGLSNSISSSVYNLFVGSRVTKWGQADSGQNLNLDNELIDTAAVCARKYIVPWTHTARLFAAGAGFTSYKVTVPYQDGKAGAVVSGVSVTGTGLSAVLTFTATTPSQFVVNDILFWQVPDRSVTITTALIPAFKVTINNAGAVTATALVDNVDVAYAPTTIYIAVPCFISAAESVGDMIGAGADEIVNVTNIANWAVGDYIYDGGNNLYLGTRIKTIVGDTITLNFNSRDQHNGVALYNCKLTAY